MKLIDTWHLPIKTVSEQNMQREHWAVKAKRHRTQKNWVAMRWLQNDTDLLSLPIHIKLTRISPRKLDYDNLCCSQKFVFDALCECFIPGLAPGRADSDPRITVEYHQEKGKPKEYGVKIEFYNLSEGK